MANAEILKVAINPEYIIKRMREEKIGYRPLSKKIGISSDRQIRYYMEKGKMPPYILNKICQELKLDVSKALKGKTIWMRIGVTVPVTDDEFQEFISGSTLSDCVFDYEFDDSVSVEYLRRAIADGESYIPRDVIIDCQKLKREGC